MTKTIQVICFKHLSCLINFRFFQDYIVDGYIAILPSLFSLGNNNSGSVFSSLDRKIFPKKAILSLLELTSTEKRGEGLGEGGGAKYSDCCFSERCSHLNPIAPRKGQNCIQFWPFLGSKGLKPSVVIL